MSFQVCPSFTEFFAKTDGGTSRRARASSDHLILKALKPCVHALHFLPFSLLTFAAPFYQSPPLPARTMEQMNHEEDFAAQPRVLARYFEEDVVYRLDKRGRGQIGLVVASCEDESDTEDDEFMNTYRKVRQKLPGILLDLMKSSTNNP